MRVVGIVLAALMAVPAVAETSEEDKRAQCEFQAGLIGAVQQARMDRVRKARVTETLMAENPDWPDGVATALPAITEYVYAIKRRDLRNVDLGAQTLTTCLANFEQIQALGSEVKN